MQKWCYMIKYVSTIVRVHICLLIFLCYGDDSPPLIIIRRYDFYRLTKRVLICRRFISWNVLIGFLLSRCEKHSLSKLWQACLSQYLCLREFWCNWSFVTYWADISLWQLARCRNIEISWSFLVKLFHWVDIFIQISRDLFHQKYSLAENGSLISFEHTRDLPYTWIYHDETYHAKVKTGISSQRKWFS